MSGIGNVDAIRACVRHDASCEYCGGMNLMGVGVVRWRLRDGVQVADPIGELVACPVLGGLGEVVALLPPEPGPRDGAA